MPFEKVETQAVDFPALERDVLAFWESHGIFAKHKARNEGKPPWSFLDGPITANNPMGVHHAWNRTYKDAWNRYFSMNGRELRYQQGFDCQGLWVEVEVEKELKLGSKRDIENLVPGDRDASVAMFVQACKDRVNKYARQQTMQSIRLGYWMNWDVTDDDWAKRPDDRHSYFTMSESNNYAIWHFLKKCADRKLVYRGYDAMPWCGRCGVGISEQEKAEGYKLVDHRAVFVRFPLHDRPNENLLVWTTTPWTLSSNVAAAVNPTLTYLKIQVKDQFYYVAKGAFKVDRMASSGGEGDDEPAAKKSKRDWLKDVPHLKSIEQHFKEKAGKDGFTVAGEVKGAEMLGWAYDGPFDALPANQSPFGFPEEVSRIVKQGGWCKGESGASAHRVIAWADVGETEGTGIVHIAPGCGPEDYKLGRELGLPPVAPLGEDGYFVPGFGALSGLNAAEHSTADVVFDQLKANDRTFAIERYVHKYPHCWRCKKELLYRLVDEWFIGMSWRDEIAAVTKKVTFLPESVNGQARELDWLKNMGDWMISKKRYWGLALPIWVDDADPTQFEVLGSYAELKARAVEGWGELEGKTPHRPAIDRVKIRNPRTGNLMTRVPDVGNPWLDAGIVAFSTLKYADDPAYWAKWYPAEFITESLPGQFRNWFYALLAMSTMMGEGAPPFKVLLGFATVRDQFGQPMHKSDGNSIEFNGAANDGYELFIDADPAKKPDEALKLLPKGYLSHREEAATGKDGKPVKRVVGSYKPIGADVIRWLYCRHSPAQNLNFGPEPTDEVRRNFVLKLWNCYALLCNYARPDGFDPAAPQVPLARRPDIDRWILSDLQKLVAKARTSFENFNLMAFALEAESFVDETLSNGYIRINRDRFWSKNADLDAAGREDKQSAYQTLYATAVTLCKLIAPCVPFLAETMYQNLRLPGDPESVHLCDYPTPDAAMVDEALSAELETVLRVVSLGGSVRDREKLKVRQPLAELRVKVPNDAARAAVLRFAPLIQSQLNVHAVSVVPELLAAAVKLNRKTAGAKIGPHLKAVEAELSAKPAEALQELLRSGPVEFAGVPLAAEDFTFEFAAPAGWAGVEARGTQVAIDTRVTPALKREGLARDVIRLVQEERKKAGFDLADRIALGLFATGELGEALAEHRESIATATQAVTWLADDGTGTMLKVDGQELRVRTAKA